MKTVTVHGTGSDVALSKLVMGTTWFGTTIPEDTAFDLLDAYFAGGGRTIDSARVYGQTTDGGPSITEQLLGRWLRQQAVCPREEIILVTKGGHPRLADISVSRLSPTELWQDMHQSLEELGVASVDVYLLHRDDESLPVGPIVDQLHRFIEDGLTKAVGVSNWTTKRIREANDYAKAHGKTPITVSQIQWSLAHCTKQAWGDSSLVFMDDASYREYLDMGIPVMGFSSQAKGFFTQLLSGGGVEHLSDKAKRFLCPESLAKADVVAKLAHELAVSPTEICLAYITSNPLPAAALLGCSSVAQLEDSLQAQNVQLTPEQIDLLRRA